VPGVAKLEASDLASGNLLAGQVNFIACSSAGNCTAAGSYGSASGPTSAASVFVVAEQNGTWSTATTVPGATSADALSCPSAGNCVLGGIVATTGTDTSSAYLAVETNGTWDAPKTIPSRTGQAYTAVPVDIDAISCTAAGDCTVTGQALNATQQNFANGGGSYAPLVATMTNGVLGSVTELSLPSFQAPGDSNSDEGWITSLSCASAGTCTAVGIDEQQAPDAQNPPTVSIFAASEVNRTWSTPALLPGSAARNVSNTATGQLSCASASSPRPGGGLLARSHVDEAAVVALEGHRHGRGGAVTVLGDDQVRLAGSRRFTFICVFSMQKYDNVRILLNRATFSQIGQHGLFVLALFWASVELGERDDRNL